MLLQAAGVPIGSIHKWSPGMRPCLCLCLLLDPHATSECAGFTHNSPQGATVWRSCNEHSCHGCIGVCVPVLSSASLIREGQPAVRAAQYGAMCFLTWQPWLRWRA